MEQIIVTHLDGSTIKLQSKENVSRITRAEQRVEKLGVDTVDISVESAKKLSLFVGDKITIFGRDYTLNLPAKERKLSENRFSYDMQFEGVQYDLLRCQYNVNLDTTGNIIQDLSGMSLTGDIKTFLDVLIANANRIFPNKWAIGTYPLNTETKTLTFSDSDTCLSVLQTLCSSDNYDTDFRIAIDGSGNRTINVGASGLVYGHTFEYGMGKGLYELSREKVSSNNIINRLFVYGGSKNINTLKYRADRICLPSKSKSVSYLEDAASIAKYGVWESTKVFEDIYPHRVGTITAISSDVYKFVDSAMPFDLNERDTNGETKYLLPGQPAKVHFNTGKLAGYEFDISNYDHATKTFTIIKQTDANGYSFPSETLLAFQLAVGDKYVLIDIYQPQTYIDAAESEVSTKGQEYLTKYSKPQIQYGLSIDRMFLKRFTNDVQGNIFWVGDLVPIKDPDLEVDKSILITGFTRNLLDEYIYSLTVSEIPVEVSTIVRTITDVKAINNVVRMNKIADPAKARRNYKATSEIVTMIETIKAEAILIGNDPAAQFELNDAVITSNINGNANAFTVSESVIVHNYYPVGAPGTWAISAFNATGLTPATPYRLYVKASKSAATATYILSDVKVGVEDVAGYYMFPVGILSSVIDGARIFQTVKGYTLITGDSIKTGTFTNKQGQTVLNLDNRTFYGTFTFANGDNVQTKVTEAQSTANSASSAAAVAQSTANDLKNLSDTVFVGGLISMEDKAAIEAQLNVVNTQFSDADKSFLQVYSSSYLSGTPKTDLQSARNALITAKDNLISSINTAIADGKTDATEKADYNTKYTAYNNALSSFRTALETANNSINNTLKSYSDAAQTAANNAQASANNANSSVSSLNSYVDGSFKDGVIDTAEAKAIDKLNKQIDTEYNTAINDYNIVYANAYLTGSAKTDLLNAKISWAGAKDALQNSINTAIADGKTTPAEKADVDSKFTTYSTAYKSYQTAISNANKAIQQELDRLAGMKVDNMQIGGRNIVLKSDVQKTGTGALQFYNLSTPLVVGKKYAVSVKGIVGAGASFNVWVDKYNTLVLNLPSTGIAKGSFVFQGGSYPSEISVYSEISSNPSTVVWVKIEDGDKATDWTPAPEDIQAELDAAKNAAATAQADATLAKQRTEGRTVIDGGVVETNIVTLGTGGIAGMSGIPTDPSNNPLPSRWTGGTYAQAIAKLATIVEWFNGDAKYGDFWIDSSGSVFIKDANGVNRVVMTRNDVTTLDAIANSTQNTNIANTADYYSAVGTKTFYFSNNITVNNNNSTITVITAISTEVGPADPPNGKGMSRVDLYLNNVTTGVDVLIESATARAMNVFDRISIEVNKQLVIAAGTYRLKVVYTHSNYAYSCNFYSQVSSSTTNVFFDGSTQRLEIGKNGMGIIGNATNYSFRGVEGGVYKVVEKTTGVYDVPGVLAAGNIASSGANTNTYGAKVSTNTATKGGTGQYYVPHNVGSAAFTAIVTPVTDSVTCMVVVKNSTQFVVYCRNASNTLVDASFEYLLIGKNS